MMRTRSNHFECQRRQRGLAAVELTVLLPVFLMLLLATGELGHALYQYNTLTKAVRNGAIYAGQRAISDSTGVINLTGSLISATQNMVAYGAPGGGATPLLAGLSPANVSVTAVGSSYVVVSASYAYTPVFAVIPTFGLTQSNVAAIGTMTATVTARAL